MKEDAISPIAWIEVLETGIAELDEEHRTLIDHCNILTQLMEGAGAWSDIVAAAHRLAEKCSAHFRSEEAMLDQTEFPRRERHKAQHRQMEQRFRDLVDFLSGADGSSPEHRSAAQAMRDTLIDILFRHDLDYKSHLQQAAGR
jgi:hemerythrin